jgi:Domain of unknown function (DUF4189)
MTRISTFIIATAVIALYDTAPSEAAYAIAFNSQSGKAAAYNGSWDLEVARKQALSNCGSGCRVVASGKKTCAAVVESISTGTSAWAVGFASTTGGAANQGWHGCRQKGGVNCKTAAAICD